MPDNWNDILCDVSFSYACDNRQTVEKKGEADMSVAVGGSQMHILELEIGCCILWVAIP